MRKIKKILILRHKIYKNKIQMLIIQKLKDNSNNSTITCIGIQKLL